MINPKKFIDCLKNNGVVKFFGVPDSFLKEFCASLDDNNITANEGNAVARGVGYYLASGKIPLIYMQNSGLGNAINPLLSLADSEVYDIPLLLLIGWRGHIDIKDEPQHKKQGMITDKLLDTIGIKYEVLGDNFKEQIKNAISYIKKTNKSFAFLAKKGTFLAVDNSVKPEHNFELLREDAIKILLNKIEADKNSFIVSTTGFCSREVYENSTRPSHNFLTVGSMGHASSIALSIALSKKDKTIYCFDGDGALLMHLGAIVNIAKENPSNFKHILFNNYAHDSVGAQKTGTENVDYKKLFLSVGYKNIYSAQNQKELENVLDDFINSKELSFLEIKVKIGARSNLGRPEETPIQNKIAFMEALEEKNE